MARDIEEFLRRAAERRKQQLKQKQRGGGAAQSQPPSPPPQQPPRRLVIEDDQVEIVKPKKPRPSLREESVEEHVRRHIDSSDVASHAAQIGQHAASLADKIQQTDEANE